MKRIFGKLYFGAALMALYCVTAFAYLDPGTVTYVVSMIAGLVIAGGAALAIFRRKIKLFFQNLGKKKDMTDAAVSGPDMGDDVDPMADVNPLEGEDSGK